ncbi:hypothetical protein ACLB9X_14885 [Streptomyces sp. 5K101]|uniref:hypothetical protein n=1 Tax=Streptomyces sp. 5K101 TaxID=3390037 RepID=UPI003974B317
MDIDVGSSPAFRDAARSRPRAHPRRPPRAPGTYELRDHPRLFPVGRADTVHGGGSDETERTLIAERVLGLPKEPRP